MIQEKIYIVHTGYATFSIITARYMQQVIAAAPIANWTKGKNIANVLRYYTKKGAKIEIKHIRYYR